MFHTIAGCFTHIVLHVESQGHSGQNRLPGKSRRSAPRGAGGQNVQDSPADQRGDDDAPGRAAAVRVGLVLGLPPAAAEPEGVDEQEEEVQCQAGQGHTAQEEDGLQGKRQRM